MERAVVLVAACLAATLAAGLFGAVTLVGSVFILSPDRGGGVDLVMALIAFGVGLTIYSAAATVILGLPAHALLVRIRRTTLLSYAVVGLIAGALGSTLFIAGDPWILASGLAAGLAGAAAFWLVARPDRHIAAAAQP